MLARTRRPCNKPTGRRRQMMKDGHMRPLSTAFQAPLACVGVSEGGGGCGEMAGGGRKPMWVDNGRFAEGARVLKQSADWTRCPAAQTARGVNDGNQMQTLRFEHAWTRMLVWAGGNARAQGRRRPLRLVRVEHVRPRMSIRPGGNSPARNRKPVHLVRVDDDGNGVPLQPNKEAREISGGERQKPFCRWMPAGVGTAAKQQKRQQPRKDET